MCFEDKEITWSGWNSYCCMERIRLWAFPSSGGYLQLVTGTRLLPNATEASHCGPSSKASTSKVCRKWLETHLTDLSDSQSTKQFALPGRSTTQAVIFFIHTILEALDTYGRCIRIFFSDFSNGFDLVDHNVLLSELNNLDVDPHLVRWIAAFLTNRSQRVRIGNSLSPPSSSMAGHHRVPNSPPCSSAF